MPYADPIIDRQKTMERLRRLRAENPGYSSAKNAAWKAKNRPKYLAHKRVENAIKTGKLQRRPCEVCGAERAHAHHDDYSKPLDVNWLCAAHHRERHRLMCLPD